MENLSGNTDYNETEYDNSFEAHDSSNGSRKVPNVFALFAKSMGIFAVFCAFFSFFFGTFICGGLAIILAILSKGYDLKMDKNARVGFLTGIAAIVFQSSFFAFNIYSLLYVPEYRQEFNSIYEEMYGEPIEESVDKLLKEIGLPITIQ